MLALVDCNNFYASCERVFHPELNGKAVVVLSNNDGCIVARSNEAKALGIKMGEPAFKINNLLQQNKVTMFSSNYVLYGDMSRRVMNTLSEFAPEIEVYSIDEAFLNLTGLTPDFEMYAQKIRQTVVKNTGIPVSIGIGPTKVLAKTANHYAKKVSENNGVLVLDTPEKAAEMLKKFEIDEVWGIGRQYAKFLKKQAIKTAWDFILMPDSWVKKHLTINGLRIKKELEGIRCLPLEANPPIKQAICTSRSFGEFQTDLEPLKEAVATYAAKCGYKLRKQKSCAGVLIVFLETNRFNQNDPQYSPEYVYKLPIATSSSLELIKAALYSLELIYRSGYRYKKAGVIVAEIVPETAVQGSLFGDEINLEKQAEIMKTMDRINAKYGREMVKTAIQGVKGSWQMRQARLSSSYTTQWDDIITVLV